MIQPCLLGNHIMPLVTIIQLVATLLSPLSLFPGMRTLKFLLAGQSLYTVRGNINYPVKWEEQSCTLSTLPILLVSLGINCNTSNDCLTVYFTHMCHKANMVTHLLAILQKVSFAISKIYAKNRHVISTHITCFGQVVRTLPQGGKEFILTI